MQERIREVMVSAREGCELAEGAEALVDDAILQAQTAWPDMPLDPCNFASYVARHAPLSEASVMTLEGVHLRDLALAFGALSLSAVAARALDELYIQRVGEFVVRTTVDRDVIEETKQHMRTLLLVGLVGAEGDEAPQPKLTEYSGKGPLGGWLRVMAVRTALNVLRARKPTTELTAENAPVAAIAHDPQLAYLRAHDREVFSTTFQQVLADLDDTSRTMLKLHYIQGMTMSQLATVFQTSRSSVARQVAEVRARILERTSEQLKHAGVSASVIESMVNQAASKLDFTITKMLK